MKYKQGELVSFNELQNGLINYIKKNSPESLSTMKGILSELSRTHDLSTRSATYYCKSEDAEKDDPKSATFVFKTGTKTIVIGLNGVIQYNNDNIQKYADSADGRFINKAKISFFNGTTIESCSLHGKNNKNASQWQNDFGDISTIFIEPTIPENVLVSLTKQHVVPNIPFSCSKQGPRQGYEYNVSFKNGNKISLGTDEELEGDISFLKKDDDNYTSDSKVFYTGIIRNFNKYKNGIIKDISGNNIFVKSDENGDFIGYSDSGRTQQSAISIGKLKNKLAKILLKKNDAITTNDLHSKTSLLENLLYAAFSKSYEKNTLPYDHIDANYTEFENSFSLQTQQCNVHGSSKTIYLKCNTNGEWYIAVKDDNKPQNDGYEVYFSNGTMFKGTCIKNDDNLQFCNGTFFKAGKYLDSNTTQSISDVFNINFETEGKDITEEIEQKFNETDFVGIEKLNGKYENVVYGHMFENSIMNNNIIHIDPKQDYKNRIIENVFSQLSAGLYDFFKDQTNLQEYIEEIRQKTISDEAVEILEKALNKLNNDAKTNGYISVRGKKITSYDIKQEIERLLYAKYLYEKFLLEEKELDDEELDDEELDDEKEEDNIPDKFSGEKFEKKENDKNQDNNEEYEKLKNELEDLKNKVKKKEDENKEKKDIIQNNNNIEKEDEDYENDDEEYEDIDDEKIPNINSLQELSAFISCARSMYSRTRTEKRNPDNDEQFKSLCYAIEKIILKTIAKKCDLVKNILYDVEKQFAGGKQDKEGKYYITESDHEQLKNFLLQDILTGYVNGKSEELDRRIAEIDTIMKTRFSISNKYATKSVQFHNIFAQAMNEKEEIENDNGNKIRLLLRQQYKTCGIFYPKNKKDFDRLKTEHKKMQQVYKDRFSKKKLNNGNAKEGLPGREDSKSK